MPFADPWLAFTWPPLTVTSTPFSVFVTGFARSIVTSVENVLFSSASSSSGKYYISKRDKTDIWQGLYEFPLVETDSGVDRGKLLELLHKVYDETISDLSSEPVFEMQHRLSHRVLHIHIYTAKSNENSALSRLFTAVHWKELSGYAFPVPLTRFIRKHRP